MAAKAAVRMTELVSQWASELAQPEPTLDGKPIHPAQAPAEYRVLRDWWTRAQKDSDLMRELGRTRLSQIRHWMTVLDALYGEREG